MKWFYSSCLVFFVLILASNSHGQDDFAEFEGEEDVQVASDSSASADSFDSEFDTVSQPDEIVDTSYDEDDEDDDGYVEDGDEDEDSGINNARANAERDSFDGFEDDEVIKSSDDKQSMKVDLKGRKVQGGGPKLKINEVPAHLRNNWKLFYVEGVLLGFILWYIFNFFIGKKKNEDIAKVWFSENREFLAEQFSQVGENNDEAVITAQGHNTFTVWCTGRKGLEGMFIEINLIPRQDLISVWRNKFNRKRSQNFDTVTFSLYLDEEEPMEPIVAAFGQVRPMTELWKNFSDIRTFCPKGPKDKSQIIQGYQGCAESQEMITYLFDKTGAQSFQSKAGCKLNYMHISDNYTSNVDPAAEEENQDVKKEEKAKRLMVVSIQLDADCESAENSFDSLGFLKGTMYVFDRLKRMKLSREVKNACDNRRKKAVEDEQKRMHKSRQADIAARTEARRRQMNQRIMDEEDPDKQRKLAEAQSKKDDRKRQKRLNKGAKTMKIH